MSPMLDVATEQMLDRLDIRPEMLAKLRLESRADGRFATGMFDG